METAVSPISGLLRLVRFVLSLLCQILIRPKTVLL